MKEIMQTLAHVISKKEKKEKKEKKTWSWGRFTNEMFVRIYEIDIIETDPKVECFSLFSGFLTSLRTSG